MLSLYIKYMRNILNFIYKFAISLSMTNAEASPNDNESTDRNIEAGEEQPLLTCPPTSIHDDDTGRKAIVTEFWKSGPALALG